MSTATQREPQPLQGAVVQDGERRLADPVGEFERRRHRGQVERPRPGRNHDEIRNPHRAQNAVLGVRGCEPECEPGDGDRARWGCVPSAYRSRSERFSSRD